MVCKVGRSSGRRGQSPVGIRPDRVVDVVAPLTRIFIETALGRHGFGFLRLNLNVNQKKPITELERENEPPPLTRTRAIEEDDIIDGD